MTSIETQRDVSRDADSEVFLRELFARSPVAHQVFDAFGRHLYSNEAYRKLFGAIPGADFDIRRDERIQDPIAHDLIRRVFEGEAHVLPKLWFYPDGQRQGRIAERLAVETTAFPMVGYTGALRFVIFSFRDVTEELALQEQFAEARWFFEKAQEVGRMGGWIADLTGERQLKWSKQVHRMFGVNETSFNGDFDAFMKIVHPDDREAVRDAFTEAENGTRSYNIKHRIRRPDGQVRWMHERAEIARDYTGRPYKMVGIVQDVTEMHELETRMRDLFDADVMGLFVANFETGRIVEANHRFLEMTGYDARDIDRGSLTWQALIPAEQKRDGDAELAQLIDTGRVVAREKDLQCRDGRRLPVLGGATATTPGAGEFLGFALDLSDYKRLEEQFRQSQKMEAIGRLAGGIAHDFNNLLSVLLLHLDKVVPQHHDVATTRSLAVMQTAAEKATRLTRQLLAFSRKQVMQIESLELNAFINDLESFFSRILSENIQLRVTTCRDLLPIRGDRGQLEQVLMNLIVNAKDAIRQSGSIHIETDKLELSEELSINANLVLAPGVYAVLKIIDTGRGMTDEILKKAFEPFFTTKDIGTGTGLGLATVFGIVKQIGGEIHLQSRVEKGTTASVFLPLVEGAATPKPTDREPYVHGSETILLVEDETDLREVTEEILRENGYTVISAANAAEALKAARQPDCRFDLLITDVLMPDLSGPALVKNLCETHKVSQWKYLFLSGYPAEELARYNVSPQDDNFLTKPYTASALLHKVRESLSRMHKSV